MKHYCAITGAEIPPERVEALVLLGVPQHLWTTMEGAKLNDRRVKGVWDGETGASKLILSNSIGADRVERVGTYR